MNWRIFAIVTGIAVLCAVFVSLTVTVAFLIGRVPKTAERAVAPQTRQSSPDLTPIVSVMPPTDPDSRVFDLLLCARSVAPACHRVGAWLIAQSGAGHEPEVCLRAGEIEQCTAVGARWPGAPEAENGETE